MDIVHLSLLIRVLVICVLFGLLVIAAALLGRGDKDRRASNRRVTVTDPVQQRSVMPGTFQQVMNRRSTQANDSEASPPGPQKHAA